MFSKCNYLNVLLLPVHGFLCADQQGSFAIWSLHDHRFWLRKSWATPIWSPAQSGGFIRQLHVELHVGLTRGLICMWACTRGIIMLKIALFLMGIHTCELCSSYQNIGMGSFSNESSMHLECIYLPYTSEQGRRQLLFIKFSKSTYLGYKHIGGKVEVTVYNVIKCTEL